MGVDRRRCIKSEGKGWVPDEVWVENELTAEPFCRGSAGVYLFSQFTHHFLKTRCRIQDTVSRFQSFAYGTIDNRSRNDELQEN